VQLSEGSFRPLAPSEILRGVPQKTVLVEYAALKDRLLIWVLRPGLMQMQVSPLSARDVETLAARFRAELEERQSEDAIVATSVSLYKAVIAPIVSRFQDGDSVIFIPDKSLNLVPFAALRDESRGRYLIEDHAIGIAPSATLFLQCLGKSRSSGTLPVSDALVVGNPKVDLSLFQNLGPLQGASREISEVTAAYGKRAEVLVESSATPAAVLERAGSKAVLHVASHSLANVAVPALSSLLLTPSGSEDGGLLYARDIERNSFPRTRLVVLAACNTGGGALRESEGSLSLSRAFLAAGVPEVVASLWRVDDRSAASLFRIFHRRVRSGENALEALRQSQLALLRRGDKSAKSATLWASFAHFGA
jgi:CHAT domain-containing protein